VLAHHLGTVISQSFAATEQTFTGYAQLAPLRSAYESAAADGVSVLAGSGDLGATNYESNASTIYPSRVVAWPSSDPLVTAVGGTRLDLSATGAALSPATGWNDTFQHGSADPYPNATGGGRSEFFVRPSYQSGVAAVTGARRGVPDVAMSAACSAVVDVYVGVHGPVSQPGWLTLCGTSEATPLFAGIVALCDEEAGHGLGPLNPTLYAMLAARSHGIVAVTSGNNSVAFLDGHGKVTVPGYDAGPGYSLVTGVGTVDAARFVPELVTEWRALHR
jgi:subtilase family serine protease